MSHFRTAANGVAFTSAGAFALHIYAPLMQSLFSIDFNVSEAEQCAYGSAWEPTFPCSQEYIIDKQVLFFETANQSAINKRQNRVTYVNDSLLWNMRRWISTPSWLAAIATRLSCLRDLHVSFEQQWPPPTKNLIRPSLISLRRGNVIIRG